MIDAFYVINSFHLHEKQQLSQEALQKYENQQMHRTDYG